jgi:NACHT domain
MPPPSSKTGNQRERAWWVQSAGWLWKAAGFLGTAVFLSLLVNIASTWLTSPQGIIPANSPFGWLVIHWPITLLVGSLLLLIAGVSWVLSREQRPEPVSISLRQQNRTRMILRLRRSYQDLLDQSLEGMAWMELTLSERPDALLNASTLLFRSATLPEHPLPVGTSILSAYDQSGHELLILGVPGAGKSSLLLRLAQQLVERAATDATHSLPIILPLSSWAAKKPPLHEWLSEQLTQIYDVPRQLSEHWVQEEAILPLLDGLDEMDASSYPACIAAINNYHHDHMMPLVVCSRIAEYETISQEHLSLQNAIVIQPLTHEQVDGYLIQAGKPVAALRRAIKKNSALQDLASTPLMLGVLMLTYQGTAVRELPMKQGQLQQQVWTNYIERMVASKGDVEQYPLGRTCSWLGWLARQMRDHNQTVFYLEYLQPDWLTGRQQQSYARQAMRLPALLSGILVSLLITLLLFNFINPASLLQYAVMGGLLGWLFSRPVLARERHPLQGRGPHHRGRARLLARYLLLSVIIGLIVGLSFGLDLGEGFGPDNWLRDGPLFGVTIGLSSLLLCSLLPGEGYASPPATNRREQGWRKLMPRFLQGGQAQSILWVIVLLGLSYGLNYGLGYGLRYGLSDGLFFALSYGLVSTLVCLTLRTQAGDITFTERLRWTRNSLMGSPLSRKHVRTTLFLACTIALASGLSYGVLNWLSYGPILGLSYGLSLGLSYGLSFGLLYWILLGLFQGVASERIEDHSRQIPNQGIRRSWHNSLLVALISAGSIAAISTLGNVLSFGLSDGLRAGLDYGLRLGLSYGFTGGLNHGLSYGLGHGLNYGLNFGWFAGLCGGLLAWSMYGGLATVRHYSIRLLLSQAHTFPRHIQAFLDDATTRILLRRVGGGYSFAHRLLLDHFADSYHAEALEKAATASHGQASVSLPL